VQNLTTARHYTAHKGLPGGPRFRLLDTTGNRACFDQLSGLVCDPDKAEQVLKMDADASGQGGDDMADETFYALASRPYAAPNPLLLGRATDHEALAHAYAAGADIPEDDFQPSGSSDYDVVDHG
jgi:hypothetical protein